jgi:hypothetical protein
MNKKFRGCSAAAFVPMSRYIVLRGIEALGERATSVRVHKKISGPGGFSNYPLSRIYNTVTVLLNDGMVQRPFPLREEAYLELTQKGLAELRRMNRLMRALTAKGGQK